MYAHEVFASSDGAGLRHFRQTQLPSGLITVEEIARSSAVIDAAQRRQIRIPAGLYLPPTFDPAAAQPEEEPTFVRKIDCQDIAAFVHEGVAAWRTLLQSFQASSVHSVAVNFAEKRSMAAMTPSIDTLAAPGDFVSYYATLDELDALESMRQQVNGTIPKEPPVGGYYL